MVQSEFHLTPKTDQAQSQILRVKFTDTATGITHEQSVAHFYSDSGNIAEIIVKFCNEHLTGGAK